MNLSGLLDLERLPVSSGYEGWRKIFARGWDHRRRGSGLLKVATAEPQMQSTRRPRLRRSALPPPTDPAAWKPASTPHELREFALTFAFARKSVFRAPRRGPAAVRADVCV